jgi:putative transposase
MALPQSDVSALLDALRSGDGVDLVRDLVRLVLQELVEAEATSVIGAGRYERSAERLTERNGHRSRTLSTKAGDLEVKIPKLRKGSYFPSFLEPRRRIDQALYAVVMEAYVKGVSTRSVDDLVAALGVASGISRSEVSRICRQLDEAVEAFRTRRLDHARFPYVYLDATYLHVRADHHVVSKAVVIATGVREDGHREVLGVAVGDSEDELFWRTFLTSLKERGLSGVQLVISDQHAGLVAAIGRCFQGAAHQRCRVHFARNLLACVPKGNQEMVAAAFRTIFAQATKEEMATQWDHVRATFAERFGKAASLMDTAKEEVLAFGAFPRSHWRHAC